MIDDVLALLVELAESADPQVMEAALDRHHIDDPELRAALLNKDSQALLRFLGPGAPSPNNSSVYSVEGSSNMNISWDGDSMKFTLIPDINVTLTSKKDPTQKYHVTSGALEATQVTLSREAPDNAV